MKNPTLYVTEIVIAIVYILAFIWARWKDKKDIEKVIILIYILYIYKYIYLIRNIYIYIS